MNRTHVYLAPLTDLVRTPDEGDPIEATEGAIIDGNIYVLRIDGANAYVHATKIVAAEEGWEIVLDGREPWEWTDAPTRAPEHASKLLHARAYRRKDGGNLRTQLENEGVSTLPSRVPASGRTSSRMPDQAKADAALARARSMLGDDETPGEVEAFTTQMDRVGVCDLLEEDTIPPHEWM